MLNCIGYFSLKSKVDRIGVISKLVKNIRFWLLESDVFVLKKIVN